MLYGPELGGHWLRRRAIPPDLSKWPSKWRAANAREVNRSAGSSTGDKWRDQGFVCDCDIAELGDLLRRTRVDIVR